MYLYAPTHKRGKAKKFSYQYKGPFEIEQKISPLIYKVWMTDVSSTIVHINRLKRAHGQEQESGRIVTRKRQDHSNRPFLYSPTNVPELDLNTPTHTHTTTRK